MSEYDPIDREMDWDDEIENDSAYTVLPEGDYRFKVQKFERARHKGSAKIPPCKKAILTLDVSDGEHAGTMTTSLLLHKSMEWKLSQFFVSIGEKEIGQRVPMNWKAVPGAAGVCKLGTHTWKGDDGKEHESNEVAQFYAPAEAPNVPVNSGFTKASQADGNPWDTGEF